MFQDFARRVSEELQHQFGERAGALPTAELNAAVQAALRKLQLVTRDEFDAQAAVLQRTRERLEALEQLATRLESELASKS